MPLHRVGRAASCAGSNDAGREPCRQTAPRRRTSPRHGRRSDDDGRGSIVSRGSLFQDQLLERQVRHSLAQTVVLFLKLLQPLHLVTLQAAELLAPAVIRELRHADRANRLANRFSLRQQNIDLAQLRDDLFGLMLLLGHSNVLSNGSIAYFREDHFSGGRPAVRRHRKRGRSHFEDPTAAAAPPVRLAWPLRMITILSVSGAPVRLQRYRALTFSHTLSKMPIRPFLPDITTTIRS